MAQSTQTWNNPPAVTATMPPRRSVLIGYMLAVIAYAVFFSLWQVEPVPWQVHAAAILVAATCFIPMARWYATGAQGLPMFELICLSYAVQFSTPVYHQPNAIILMGVTIGFAWEDVFQTLLLVEIGILALLAGYYLFRRSPLSGSLPRLDLPLQPDRRSRYLALSISLGLGALFLQWTGLLQGGSSLGSLIGVAANQLYIALILLAYEVFGRPRPRRWQRNALLGLTTLAVAWGLASGMLENVFVPLALILIVRWHVRRTMPWALIVAGVLAFIILNSAKLDYRSQVWYGDTNLGLTDRLGLWAELSQQVVQEAASDDPLTGASDLARSSMYRFDLLHKFVHVQRLTPRYIPFYNGTSYEYLLIGWIPRMVWPDKPVASESNQDLDVDYGLKLLSQVGRSTIGIGQLPEAYANFGVTGIVVVLLLQGMIFAGLNSVLNGPRSDGGRAIYLSTMIFFLNGIGSSTAIWFGALFQNVIANALILRLFAAGWQAATLPEPPAAAQPAPGSSDA